jgi:hypothetical protein
MAAIDAVRGDDPTPRVRSDFEFCSHLDQKPEFMTTQGAGGSVSIEYTPRFRRRDRPAVGHLFIHPSHHAETRLSHPHVV